jgi:rubredoxin
MAKYKCSVCGYIYDEEKEGQPLAGGNVRCAVWKWY